MKKKSICILPTLLLLAACNGGGGGVSSMDNPSSADNNSIISSTPISSESPSSVSSEVPQEDNKVHLIILAGQSGARGKAINADLTDEQKEVNEDVDIMADGLRMESLGHTPEHISSSIEIDELKPGYGDGGTEFGPELGMGETMRSRYLKDGESRKSVIIKYTACGSTFTSDWYSTSAIEDESVASSLDLVRVRDNEKIGKQTGPLTNNLYELIDQTIAQLEDEDYEAVIDGAVFLHGEQDAKFDVNMSIYEKALEYFVNDLRDYVGNPELPVVITEAVTNSAKYSNTLRDIQKRVASKLSDTTFISARDLYTNTFEPWHFGGQSTMELGNRIAAEIISHYDYRQVESFEEKSISVPLGCDIELPQYLYATFTNGMTGMIKVSYTSSYDKNTLGEQNVAYKATTVYGDYEGSLKVTVTNEPYVDGVLQEYDNVKKNTVEGIGDIYVVKGENGLYIAADINDNDIWTDGEAWSQGDMGQSGKNDDFRIYITSGEAEDRMSIYLSSANLLRVYESGTDFSNELLLPRSNVVFQKGMEETYAHHVNTKGLMNVEGEQLSEGMTLELYISYTDLCIDNPDDILLCFNYSNVTSSSGQKTATDHYYSRTNAAKSEEDINNYFSISELI